MPHVIFTVQDQENDLEFEFDNPTEARRKLSALAEMGIIAYMFVSRFYA